MKKQWCYQNLKYAIMKNQDLSKNQEAKGLLINLGLKTLLSKVPLLCDVLF